MKWWQQMQAELNFIDTIINKVSPILITFLIIFIGWKFLKFVWFEFKTLVDRKKQQTKELKNKKVKTFSMENVQKKDKEIKKQTLNKEKQHKHEQSL